MFGWVLKRLFGTINGIVCGLVIGAAVLQMITETPVLAAVLSADFHAILTLSDVIITAGTAAFFASWFTGRLMIPGTFAGSIGGIVGVLIALIPPEIALPLHVAGYSLSYIIGGIVAGVVTSLLPGIGR